MSWAVTIAQLDWKSFKKDLTRPLNHGRLNILDSSRQAAIFSFFIAKAGIAKLTNIRATPNK